MARVRALTAGGALIVCVLTSCVGPVRDFGAYRDKASSTARDMVSPVEAARVAVTLARHHDAFSQFVDTALTDAQDDASSIQQAFESIQPPDEESKALRSTLDDLLTNAVDTLQQLRIAERLGQDGRLPALAKPLGDLSTRLRDFAEEHHS